MHLRHMNEFRIFYDIHLITFLAHLSRRLIGELIEYTGIRRPSVFASFFCLNGDIWNFFTEMFIELSSTFHMPFVQIGVFEWLSGRQKGSIFEKNI